MRRDYYETAFKELKGLLRFLDSGNLTPAEEQEARRHVKRILERKREDVKRDDNQYASMLRDAVRVFAAKAPID